MTNLQTFFEDFETQTKKVFNNYGEAAYSLDQFLDKYGYILSPEYDDVTDFLKPIRNDIGHYTMNVPVFKDNVEHQLTINFSKEDSKNTDFIPLYTIDYKVV